MPTTLIEENVKKHQGKMQKIQTHSDEATLLCGWTIINSKLEAFNGAHPTLMCSLD